MTAIIDQASRAPASPAATPRKQGEEIVFSIAGSAIDLVLLARSTAGVCAILIGSDTDTLRGDLAGRFPGSALRRDDEALRPDLRKVTRFFGAPAKGLQLPLDPRGTPFQRRVWEALQGVRAGEVITYAALARRIGEPTAVRAVAGACASNPLALAIPCHRVVRTNGGLAGYRWGLERKRALIDREARR